MSAADKLKDLPEIDIQQGLTTVMGNEGLYFKLLGKLDSNIEKSIAALGSSNAESDMRVVSFEAHALKGTMYNLGIMTIGDTAKNIERLAKDDDRGEVARLLPPFLKDLADFKQRLNAVLK